MADLNQLDIQANNQWDVVSSPVEQQWWETQHIQSIEQALQWAEPQKVVYTKASEITDYSIPSLGSQPSATSTEWNTSAAQSSVMAAKKARLIQLLRSQLNKWKKIWFTRGILSWVAIMSCIVIALVVFAKDTVLSMLSDDLNNTQASVINITAEDTDEVVVDEDLVDEDLVDENLVDEDIVDENLVDEDIVDEDIVDEDIVDEDVVDEDIVDEDVVDEDLVDEDIVIGEWYTIKPVNSTEDANWVINPNCEWLSCEDIDLSSIALCHDFRLKPDMDDNAQRIWKSWVCRYKDVSELAYVEIQ